MSTGWTFDMATCPDDEPFIAAIRVRNIMTKEEWVERHAIWIDDETGDIHKDCDQGWSLFDYEAWHPMPVFPNQEQSQ